MNNDMELTPSIMVEEQKQPRKNGNFISDLFDILKGMFSLFYDDL